MKRPSLTAARLLAFGLSTALFLVSGASRLHAQSKQDKPNILFLFTDDMRADCIGALGHPAVKTPNIDSLVNRGMTFTKAFCLGSDMGAVCTPSRNMLMSGRAYFRWNKQKPNLAPADGPNLPVAMKSAGYETWHLGKKGNTATLIQATFEHNHYASNDQAERMSGNPGGEYANGAIKFLTQDRDKSRPFFMYLAFGNPHDPRVADQKWLDLYQRDAIPLPANYAPQHPWNIGSNTVRDELLAPFPRTPEVVRQHLHEYYAVISCLDHHIGRILAALNEQGLADNTIIVFSSDHGLAVGSHGLFGKQNVYDAGYNAPLIFAGPGIPQGKSEALCYLMDIMPTICDLGGAKKPDGLDALSLAPVIAGKQEKIRDALFLSYTYAQKAVREEDWKLIRFPLIARTQLFDLVNDPHETKNLANDPKYNERVNAMMEKLALLKSDFGDDAGVFPGHIPEKAEFTPPTEAERAALTPAKGPGKGKGKQNAN
jgi:arylsulfatase A-like enzyme